MAKRLCASLLALLLILVCLPVSADGGDRAGALIEGIERYKVETDRQAWLDGELTDTAGQGAEWYVPALIKRYPTLDYSRYEAALREALSEGSLPSVVTKMNCALVLALLGSSPELIQTTLDESIGRLGIMSWIYGLHLLNAGYSAAEYTADGVVETLLGLRKNDGGWALSGTFSDVDVTAMTLQALAQNRDIPGVSDAIDRALALLASRQQESGGFKSYGTENANSSAMVLLALACLGVDAADAGFAGGYSHLLDGIAQYATASGGVGFITTDKDANEVATRQVYLALSAYEATRDGKTSVFLPDVAQRSFTPTDRSAPHRSVSHLILYVSVPVLAVSIGVFVFLRKRKETAAKPPK